MHMQISQISQITSISQPWNPSQICQSKTIQLFLMIDQINHQIDTFQLCQQVIVLFGDTNAGKTTLMYYLSGLQLQRVKDPQTGVVSMECKQIYKNAQISGTVSTTSCPNHFNQQNNQYSILDMPGSNDDRFINRIVNLFTYQKIFNQSQKLNKIHVCLVISGQIIEHQVINKNINQFIDFFNIEAIKQKLCFSLVFTKIQNQQNDQQTYQQQENTLFQILEDTKNDLQQGQNLQKILNFIEILQKLKQQHQATKDDQQNPNKNKFIYYFSDNQPQIQDGLKITKEILSRKCFYDNKNKPGSQDIKISLTNEKLISKIISQNLNIDKNFTKKFYQTLNELDFLYEKIIRAIVQYGKLLYIKYNQKKLNQQQTETKTNPIQLFCQQYYGLFNSFKYKTNEQNNDVLQIEDKLNQRKDNFNKFIQLTFDKQDYQQNQTLIFKLFLMIDQYLNHQKSFICQQTQKQSFYSFYNLVKRMTKLFINGITNQQSQYSQFKQEFIKLQKFCKWIQFQWIPIVSKIQNSKLQQRFSKFIFNSITIKTNIKKQIWDDQQTKNIKTLFQQFGIQKLKRDDLYDLQSNISQQDDDDTSSYSSQQIIQEIIQYKVQKKIDINQLNKLKQEYLLPQLNAVKQSQLISTYETQDTQLEETQNEYKQQIQRCIQKLKVNIKQLKQQSQGKYKQQQHLCIKTQNTLYVLINLHSQQLLLYSLDNFYQIVEFILSQSAKKQYNRQMYLQNWAKNIADLLIANKQIENAIRLYLWVSLTKPLNNLLTEYRSNSIILQFDFTQEIINKIKYTIWSLFNQQIISYVQYKIKAYQQTLILLYDQLIMNHSKSIQQNLIYQNQLNQLLIIIQTTLNQSIQNIIIYQKQQDQISDNLNILKSNNQTIKVSIIKGKQKLKAGDKLQTINKKQVKQNNLQTKQNNLQTKQNNLQTKQNRLQTKQNKFQTKQNSMQINPHRMQIKQNNIYKKQNKITDINQFQQFRLILDNQMIEKFIPQHIIRILTNKTV